MQLSIGIGFNILKEKIARWVEASKNWVATKTAATPSQAQAAPVAAPAAIAAPENTNTNTTLA